MIIKLPIRPLSVNAAWCGRRFKSKAYRAFEKEISVLLLPYKEKITGYCAVLYRFHLKNWKKTDGDNCVKTVQDFIVKRGIIEDDRFIMRYVIEKVPSDRDFVEVEIEPINYEETR